MILKNGTFYLLENTEGRKLPENAFEDIRNFREISEERYDNLINSTNSNSSLDIAFDKSYDEISVEL